MGRTRPGHKQKGPKVPAKDRKTRTRFRMPPSPPGHRPRTQRMGWDAVRSPLRASLARAALGELGAPLLRAGARRQGGARGAHTGPPGESHRCSRVGALRPKLSARGGRPGARRATEPYPSPPRPEGPQARPPHAGGLLVLRQAPQGCPDSSRTGAQPGYVAPAPLPPRPAPWPHRLLLTGAGSGESLEMPRLRRPGCSVTPAGARREPAGISGAPREEPRGRGRPEGGGERGGDPRPRACSASASASARRSEGRPAPGGGARRAPRLGHQVRPRVGAAPAEHSSLRLCAAGRLFRFAESR